MRKTVQELADARLAPEYRQPVKTLDDAMDAVGWSLDVDPPTCCGRPVTVSTFIGDAYQAVCETCKRFVFDVTGPEFSNERACVLLPSSDEYDLDTDARWVSGQMTG